MAAIATSMSKAVARGGLPFSRILEDLGAREVVVVEAGGAERTSVFIAAYLVLMASSYISGAGERVALVLEDPEILIKDINLLSYDSREPWERVYLSLEYLKDLGLILVSRDPPRTERVWQLCGTYILTYLSEVPSRLGAKARELNEALKDLKPEEVLVCGETVRSFKLEHTRPAPIEVSRFEAAEAPRIAVAAGMGEVEIPQEREPTLLEKSFGDDAPEAAAILDKCGRSVSIEELSSHKREVVDKLKELGFIRDDILVGHAILTEPGERALKEYRDALKTGLRPRITQRPEAPPAQTLIDAGEALERVDEVDALYIRAESLWRQQKYVQAVMTAYKYMVQALKKAYNIETGHLDDLVARVGAEGAGITVEEAKTAKTLMIAAGRGEVGITDATKILSLARKVRARLSALGGGG